MLLSDPDHEAGKAYGSERDADDPYIEYPNRVSYVIDPEGVIRLSYIVASTQIAGHPQRVLDDLEMLIDRPS